MIEINRDDIPKPESRWVYETGNCRKCGGSGIYSRFHGECWRCGGHGKEDFKIRKRFFPLDWSDEKIIEAEERRLAGLEKARKTRERNRLAKVKAKVAKAIEFLKERGAFDAMNFFFDLDGFEKSEDVFPASKLGIKPDEFMDDLSFVRKVEVRNAEIATDLLVALRDFGNLTDKQWELLPKLAATVTEVKARAEAEEAAKATLPPLEEGRAELTGEVVTTKWKDSHFGCTLKMLVRLEDGNKVWGSVPKALVGDEDSLRSSTVTFTATVERSNDDPHFGFFKRPAKALILAG